MSERQNKFAFEVAWTDREVATLIRHYRDLPNAAAVLGERMGRTCKAVRIKAAKLRVTKPRSDQPWTESDLLVLRLPISNLAAARRLGRTRGAVGAKRWRMRKKPNLVSD